MPPKDLRMDFYQNTEYEILTQDGFKDFLGLSETESDSILEIETDNTNLICTTDHKIHNTSEFVEAQTLTTNDFITTSSGKEQIRNITKQKSKQSVYDLISVQDTSSFFANNILVHNCLVLDEFAFVPENIAEDFFTSVYPTITSGHKTKVIMISTPNGMNLFHKFWIDAEEGRNAYKTYVATWRCRPDRDEKWAKETLANMGELKFSQEFEVLFLGSQDTLISGSKLAKLTFINPVTIHRSLKIYEYPNPSHMYMITVDCGKGKEQDYSTFVVIDITEFPYKVSAVYRDNKISPILYPEEIRNCATMYNDAFVLIEVNDVGYQVATTLQRELEYENMLTTTSQKTKQVLRIGCGYSYKHNMGVITSKSVKAIGCSNLKSIIEGDQLIINDHDILSELTTFIGSKNTFAADDGHHDDLVMNLVLFSWAYNQEAFKDLTDLNLRERLMSLKEEADEESTLPIGFKCDGSPDSEEDESFVADGCVWEADPVEVYDQTTSYADIEED